jgi:hypothetical protein
LGDGKLIPNFGKGNTSKYDHFEERKEVGMIIILRGDLEKWVVRTWASILDSKQTHIRSGKTYWKTHILKTEKDMEV